LLEGVDLGDVQVEWKKMLSSSLLSPSSSPSPTSEEAVKLSNAEASETPEASDASPAEAKPETPERTETQESTHEHSQPKQETIALSAFALSSLPSALARKQLVKEIWESGADTIVLIDHNNIEGFEHIAQARELLLKLGRKEIERAEAEKAEAKAGVEGQETSAIQESAPVQEETALQQDSSASETPTTSTIQSTQPAQAVQATPSGPLGSYALAPCPHDGVCPLYRPQSKAHKLICGFSQRIQRPAFVRKTKASGVGHEDIGYSYVVIRRGARPGLPADEVAGTDALDFMKRGRVGLVGKRDEERRMERAEAALGPKEIEELEAGTDAVSPEGTEATEKTSSAEYAADLQASPRSSSSIASTGTTGVTGTTSLEDALRLEANRWPRLIFPPLKRSGHIILDVCSPTGKILRSTIPKSQGKQPYYDARKSDWGDLFPHAPKNKPVERHIPEDKKSKDKGKGGGEHQAKGTDIGKRGVRMGKEDTKERPGYGAMSEGRQKGKKETRKARGLKTKYDPGDEDDD
jgi:ribosomal protein RSM22 (predicted rRNA methylase)